jgi:hypothetical protein
MTLQYGGTETFESVSVCVVYDQLTGEIQHWHHSLTIAGGQHPSPDQMATDALSIAGRRTDGTRELRVLQVDPHTDMNQRHRVDCERGTLVVLPQEPQSDARE